MVSDLYCLLLLYFAAGALAIGLINRKKESFFRRTNWVKYLTYFFIVNLLFISITFRFFPLICFTIVIFGAYELFRLLIGKQQDVVGFFSLLVFLPGFYSLMVFSFLEKPPLYYVLFLVTGFDAFSQLSGQYWGKRKLIPAISPNKTVEGLMGGLILSIITGIVIRQVLNLTILQAILWSLGIILCAFAGDLFASFIKRRYKVKDFSRLIPGHGGFLDRFDSLIFSTFFVHLMNYLFSS